MDETTNKSHSTEYFYICKEKKRKCINKTQTDIISMIKIILTHIQEIKISFYLFLKQQCI